MGRDAEAEPGVVTQERPEEGLKTLDQGVLGQPSCFDQECLHFAQLKGTVALIQSPQAPFNWDR